MKFIIQLLTVVAIAYAENYYQDERIPIVDRVDEVTEKEFNPFLINKECGEIISKYSECFVETVHNDDKKYKEACSKYESENCQKFYKMSLTDFPECKDNQKIYLLAMDEYRKIEYAETKFSCLKDEKGEYCPLTQMGLYKKYDYNTFKNETIADDKKTEYFNKAMNDTCNSKICSNGYVDFINVLNDEHKAFYEEATKYKEFTDSDKKAFEQLILKEKTEFNKNQPVDKIVSYLKNEKCVTESDKTTESDKPGKVEANSGTSQITYTTALFVTLALLLSTLL